jgi:high-affinity nickel-transport protein
MVRLTQRLRVVVLREEVAEDRIEGNGDKQARLDGVGILVRIFHRVFKLIDRPWKIYPLGVLFSLSFDIQLLFVQMHNHGMLRGCPLFLE